MKMAPFVLRLQKRVQLHSLGEMRLHDDRRLLAGNLFTLERGSQVAHFKLGGLLEIFLAVGERNGASFGRHQFHPLQFELKIGDGRLQHGAVAGIQQVVGEKRPAGKGIAGKPRNGGDQKNGRPNIF